MTLRNTHPLRFLDVDASRIDEACHAYDDITAGTIVGVVVRGALDAVMLARGAARLIEDERMPHLTYESGSGVMTHIYGCPTQLAPGDLGEFYAQAESCSTVFCEAFGPDYDIEGRLRSVLSAVANHRSVRRLPHSSGRSPAIGAVNRHEPGGDTPHHFDSLFFEIPSFRSLRKYMDNGQLINVNFPLERAAGGGDLEFYAYDWASFQNEYPGAGRDEFTTLFRPAEYESMRLELDVGDILIFDAGRICHSVTTVPAGQRRMNVGAHTCFEPGRESVIYFT